MSVKHVRQIRNSHDLLAKERNNSRWLPITQPTSCRSRASMMDHSGYMLEKPLMRAVANPIDVLVIRPSKVRPTFGNDGSNASETDRFQDDADYLFRVVEYNATESDINRRGPGLKELSKIVWWRVLGRVTEEEATDIYNIERGIRPPAKIARKLYWRHNSFRASYKRRPKRMPRYCSISLSLASLGHGPIGTYKG